MASVGVSPSTTPLGLSSGRPVEAETGSSTQQASQVVEAEAQTYVGVEQIATSREPEAAAGHGLCDCGSPTTAGNESDESSHMY